MALQTQPAVVLPRRSTLTHTPMTIYDQLKKEHREVEAILTEIQNSAHNPDKEARQDLLEKLKRALLPHAHAEQKTFYDRIKGTKNNEAKEQIDEAIEEHKDVETMILEMEKIDADTDAWLKQAGALQEAIAHHVAEEEDDLFKMTSSPD